MALCSSCPSATIIEGSILLASLAGSWHCIGMCGGIATLSSKTPAQTLLYHLGRLIGYLILGTLAGSIGILLITQFLSTHTHIPSTIMAIMIVLMGIGLIIQHTLPKAPSLLPKKMSLQFQNLFSKYLRIHTPTASFITGILTAFLPCGWLYIFILTAISSGSPAKGALVLMLFWLGTVPYLLISPYLLKKYLPKGNNLIKISIGLLLILLGLWRLGYFATSPIMKLSANPYDNIRKASQKRRILPYELKTTITTLSRYTIDYKFHRI